MSDTSSELTPETTDDESLKLFLKENKKNIDKIKQWEAEAEHLVGEADSYRAQAAGIIVKLLETGATERMVAKAIGKSDSHVHHAKKAWLHMQADDTIPDFNTAYKLAKRPASEQSNATSSQPEEGGGDTAPATNPYPPWKKQMAEATKLLREMIDQCSLPQAKQLTKLLQRMLEGAVEKQEAMEEQQGQS